MTVSAYRLYTVMPKLVKFVDQLTNWYVRMNRKRLKVCLSNPLNTTNNLPADDNLILLLLLLENMLDLVFHVNYLLADNKHGMLTLEISPILNLQHFYIFFFF